MMHADHEPLLRQLNGRVSALHLRQRLGLEADHHARLSGRVRRHFHLEEWLPGPALIAAALRLSLLYGRARRNALRIRRRYQRIVVDGLPAAFDGYRILHISDPHFDSCADFPRVLGEAIGGLRYDLCVFTGDYRFRTGGPIDAALAGAAEVCARLTAPAYGVLGNHDSLRMVPALEAMGLRVLLNESVPLWLGGARLTLSGVDDPHYYRADNLERACGDGGPDGVAVLLAHTPEYYRHAAHAGFRVMLCGHTHGGQICLPGGVPLVYDARCPRRLASGPWRYRQLSGYTSVGAGCSIVAARLNCPPEVTVHELVTPDRAG